MAATVARLQAVLSADTKDFDKAMDRSDGRFKGIGKAAAIGMAAVGGAAVYGFKKFADEALEAQKVTAQTNAVLKSTGGVANVTASDIDRLATSLMNKSGVDDEAIATGSNMLLTFTNIRNEVGRGNDIFNQATAATLDLSVAMGKDMQSSAILVGKALNDPLKGVSALGRAGVQFTAEQKETIKTLVESGRTMDAQKMILGELKTQFEGSAEAAGKTFSGQISIAKNQLMNMGGEIVAGVLPHLARFATVIATEVMPRLREFVQELADRLRPAFAAVVDWVRTNWPTIRAVIVGVFDAIDRAWDSVLKPAIEAVMDIFRDLRTDADRNWGGVRGAAEKVVTWYRQNLEPTIQSVVGNITAFWNEHETDIRRVFGVIQRTVQTALNVVKDVIEGVLAVIRGDWDRAWSELKSIVRRVLGALADVITNIGPVLASAALALGKAIIQGIGDGMTSLGDSLREKMVGTVQGAFDGVKSFFGISSPSTKARDELGKPITEGIAQGVLDAKVKALAAAEEVARGILDKAKSTISSEMGTFQSFVSRAFGARQAAEETKTERQIRIMEEKRERERLVAATVETATALSHANQEGGEKQIEAEKAWREALYQLELHDLRRKAEEERKALDERQWLEQQNFATRLSNLQTYLESGEATAKGARERILDFMADFGIKAGDMGELLGKGFADGLRAAIPDVVEAAKDLTEAFLKAEKVGKQKTKAERAADIARGRKGASGDRGPAPTVPGPTSGTRLDQLMSFARSLGFNPSHGQTTGGRHTPGSLHYQGRAVDLSGSPSQMQNAFYAAIQTFGGRIDELFYDPIGWYIDAGQKIRGAIGGHGSHVHLGIYDRGGVLKPGWNLAYNGLGRNEALIASPSGQAGGPTIIVNGVVGDHEDVARKIHDALLRLQRRDGSLGFGAA